MIKAALTSSDAEELLGRVKTARKRPWLDDIVPLGRLDGQDGPVVYGLTEVSMVIGRLLPRDDPAMHLLLFVAMPLEDKHWPWPRRRLTRVQASEFYP